MDLAGGIQAILWALSIGAAALTALVGAILSYHWYRFAMSRGAAFILTAVYAIVGASLLLSLFAAAAAIGM